MTGFAKSLYRKHSGNQDVPGRAVHDPVRDGLQTQLPNTSIYGCIQYLADQLKCKSDSLHVR